MGSILCFIIGLSLILVDLYEEQEIQDQKDQVEESAYEDEVDAALEDLKAESKVVAREKDNAVESVLTESRIKRGETLDRFLRRNKISAQDRKRIVKAIRQYFSPRLIMPGHRFFFKTVSPEPGSPSTLQRIIFIISNNRKLIIQRLPMGDFKCSPPILLKTRFHYVHGTVKDNLYTSGIKSGLDTSSINQLIKIYSYSVDFQRALRGGDTFEVLMQKTFDKETGFEGRGQVFYSTLFLSGGPLHLYRYVLRDGSIEYFDEKGRGSKKALLRTPVKGARISSRYGKRKHPIRGYTKMHKGVDFAAPKGTPIFAAGDGVIKKFGRLRGYGNYVFIQHNPTYGTAYAHLCRYHKGVKRGKQVKQGDIIGYVGSTGLATAPHLHYEVHRNGKQINPQSINMAPQRLLSGKPLERFLAHKKSVDAQVDTLKKSP